MVQYEWDQHRLQQPGINVHIVDMFHGGGASMVVQTNDTELHRPLRVAWQQQQMQQQQLQQQDQEEEQLDKDLEQKLAGFDEHEWQARQRRRGSPDSLGIFPRITLTLTVRHVRFVTVSLTTARNQTTDDY